MNPAAPVMTTLFFMLAGALSRAWGPTPTRSAQGCPRSFALGGAASTRYPASNNRAVRREFRAATTERPGSKSEETHR
jgi:hypothetical protein